MIVRRHSPITGKVVEKEIDITEKQYVQWHNGMLIQEAMPNLTADEREFIISGCTQADWDAIFNEDSLDD